MKKNQETPSLEGTILDDETSRELTVDRLQAQLPIEVEGYKVGSDVIIEVLTHAAVTGASIEASCAELGVGVSSNRQPLEYELSNSLIRFHTRGFCRAVQDNSAAERT